MSKALQKRLDALADVYEAECDKIIAEAREKYIIPFCNKTGYKFIAGMGGWNFYGNGETLGEWEAITGKIPKRVYQAPTMAAYNLNYNSVGSLMQDYTPPNYKG